MIIHLDRAHIARRQVLFTDVVTHQQCIGRWPLLADLAAFLKDLTLTIHAFSYGHMFQRNLSDIVQDLLLRWRHGKEYLIGKFRVFRKGKLQGSGFRFLKRIEETIQLSGPTGITLLTENNVPSFCFHQNNGFTKRMKMAYREKGIR